MYKMTTFERHPHPINWQEIENLVERAMLAAFKECPVFRFDVVITHQGGSLILYLWVEVYDKKRPLSFQVSVKPEREKGRFLFGSAIDDILPKLEALNSADKMLPKFEALRSALRSSKC